jgi:hypothetical protein
MGCYLNVKDNMYCCPNKFSIVIIKEKMLGIVSDCAQNTHCFTHLQFCLIKLSFVRTTHLFKYDKKILIFNFKLSFQIVESSLTLLYGISAKYIDLTEKLPFSCNLQINLSSETVNLVLATQDTRLCH